MDIKEIQSLIKFVAKSGASEVKLETGDVKMTIKIGSTSKTTDSATIIQQLPETQTIPATAINIPVSEAPKEASSQDAENDKYITIKSPIIGTFYRKSAPEKPAFVEIGQEIKPKDVLCVIESMKLFNEIESEISGKIVKILVDNSTPVEFDQPLFLVDPS